MISERLEIEIKTFWVKPNPKHRWFKFWQPKELRVLSRDPGEDLNQDLMEENFSLKEALNVLAFYANKSNWGNGCAAIDPCDTYTCEQGVLRGGKRAVEFLNKI